MDTGREYRVDQDDNTLKMYYKVEVLDEKGNILNLRGCVTKIL